MEILRDLGVNQTVWIQLALFLTAYFFLSTFLFKPYMRILELRKKSTTGSVEDAAQLTVKTEQLAMDYQRLFREENEKAAAVFVQLKTEGSKEEERLITAARTTATDLIDKTKKQISTDITSAREELKKQTPQLSALVASRLLGRDLNGS